MKKKLAWGLFLLYVTVMLWMLFDRQRYDPAVPYWEQVAAHLNLIPFRTNWQYVQLLDGHEGWAQWKHAVICLFGNVLTFIPLGFFLPLLWRWCRSLLRCLLWGGSAVVCIELLQMFTLVGSCDIDDLLLNLVGMAVGFGIWCRRKPR